MRETTISSPEGCHITPCSLDEKHYLQPGSPEVVPLPVDSLSGQRRSDECPPSPPSTLERGVLLWISPDGLYARRLCQSRVYWQGGLSPYGDKPNKLEREVNCKLLHTQDCLTGESVFSIQIFTFNKLEREKECTITTVVEFSSKNQSMFTKFRVSYHTCDFW